MDTVLRGLGWVEVAAMCYTTVVMSIAWWPVLRTLWNHFCGEGTQEE